MTDSDVAIDVVRRAAVVVRGRFGSALKRLSKGGDDFATEADIESEEAMLAVLRRERPDDGVIGEESGSGGAKDAARVWLLDPLCGTLNYAAGMRVVAVNAALRDADRLVAAAVSDPFTDEIYWTDGTAACVRAGGLDAPLRPSGASKLVDLNLDPPFPSAPGFRAGVLAADPAFLSRFKPRVVSSTMAVTWVATGQRAGYVTDGDVMEKEVHFAAGLALCRAAGCVVSDLRGQPWEAGAIGLVIGADASTHAALCALINP
ncbi:MAG: inositol monophosphatase family protein [Vicinamibacterales bacterium]